MADNENNPANQAPAEPAPAGQEPQPAPAWEAALDSYPARPEGQKDPRWALNLFWIWAGFTVASIVFMTVLIVLGFWYD